jgi:DHA2 family methylenomycin A resistance protein-like MFS transporter
LVTDHVTRLTTAVACVGFFVTVLDSTVVNVALPTIGRELGGSVAGLQWVVDAYVLIFAALMLSAGAVSDRVGASRAFGLGLAVFTAASTACGLSPTLITLVAARVVQGAAAAIMLPASLSLVRQVHPDATARAKAIALWAAAGGAAIAAGPVVGGLLTGGLGWPSIFFVNVPVGVAGLVGLLRAPRSRPRPAPIDLAGQLTSVLALAALTFAVIEAGSGPDLRVVLAFAAFVIIGAAFLVVEHRGPHPAVPLGLFRIRAVAVCTATGFALNFAFYGMVFVLTLLFQQVRGASPVAAGLMFLPMTALVTVINIGAGRLAARFGPRLPMVLGELVLAAGLLGLLAVGPATPTVALLLLLVPLGVGGGLAVPPMTSAMLEAVPADRSGWPPASSTRPGRWAARSASPCSGRSSRTRRFSWPACASRW